MNLGNVAITTPGVGVGNTNDSYFNYTALLLTGAGGTSAGTNNTFVDSSQYGQTVTRNSTATQGSFTPYSGTGFYSAYFDGTGDYLSTPATGQFVSTGDFTIGVWVYPTSLAAVGALLGNYTLNATTDWVIDINTDGTVRFYTNGATLRISSAAGAVTTCRWTYVAMCRSGTTITGYVNGVSAGTYTQSATFGSSTKTIYIGCQSGNSEFLNGYLSNVIFIDGSAVTTVPTSPSTAVTGTKLLTCQSYRFIDNSLNNFTITRNGDTAVQHFNPFTWQNGIYNTLFYGSSMSFNGSSDYLTLTSGVLDYIHQGATSHTIEFWMYPTSTAAQTVIGTDYASVSIGFSLMLSESQTGDIRFDIYKGTSGAYPLWRTTNGSLWGANQWCHIALTFTTGTNAVAIYVNGVSQSITQSGTIAFSASTASYAPAIGRYQASTSGEYFSGYIANLRLTRGQVLYTSAFTVSTTPLQPTANTWLLLPGSNASIYDRTQNNNIVTVSTAQYSSTQAKYNPVSISFNGSSDYLTGSSVSNLTLGGDFTIEMWIYPTTLTASTYHTLIDTRPTGSSVTGYALWIYNSRLGLSWNNSDIISPSSGTTISTATWTHVAYVRSGSTVTTYINGVSQNTATNSASCTASNLRIGYKSHSASVLTYYAGYMDDIRITNGIARYTSNFTPPTFSPVGF